MDRVIIKLAIPGNIRLAPRGNYRKFRSMSIILLKPESVTCKQKRVHMQKRREFIRAVSMAGTTMMFPLPLKAKVLKEKKNLRFGFCADVHKDIMHDADQRLKAFIQEATEQELDFIIQLGDFCRPYEYNLEFLSIWNSYPGKKYHVLGKIMIWMGALHVDR